MSAARKDLPAPDFSGTDPNEVLKSRFSAQTTPFGAVQVGNASTDAIPAHTPGMGKVDTGGRKPASTRPDPEGMRRVSLYVTKEAAAALEEAAEKVVAALGGEIRRHVALSALLTAAAEQTPAVTQDLIQIRAEQLATQLRDLQQQQRPS